MADADADDCAHGRVDKYFCTLLLAVDGLMLVVECAVGRALGAAIKVLCYDMNVIEAVSPNDCRDAFATNAVALSLYSQDDAGSDEYAMIF